MSDSKELEGLRAEVFQMDELAGYLEDLENGGWQFVYLQDYAGLPVSLTMPVSKEAYRFERFPSVFEGLLPEGPQLEALLRKHKIDHSDYFRQLITVGEDLVGSLSVRPAIESSAGGGEGKYA